MPNARRRIQAVLMMALAAAGLAACNPFTHGTGAEGKPCPDDGTCAGSLLCCEDVCRAACDADHDGYFVGETDEPDCDDASATVHPGATEVCNGADDDCDRDIDEEPEPLSAYDDDNDGYHICDCDERDAFIHPNADERCNDADDDCDGEIDEGLTAQACQRTNPAGTCTGIEICDRGVWVCNAQIPEPDVCDGLDNNCDGQTDAPTYDCPNQEGICAGSIRACVDGIESDCDYGPGYEPDTEQTCDGLDNDCDGETDEGSLPIQLVPESGVQASDGLDNNCNGLVDEPGGVMVEIMGLAGRRAWIDAYEVTVFDNPDCTGNRYGAAADDYPAEWPADGPNSIDLYACSLPDLIPSGALSRWRAARACQAQGKRLCTNAEWKLACATALSVYPWNAVDLPPDTCNDAWSGPGEPTPTGSYPNCTPNEGTGDEQTFDMIGNLAEWVADGHALDDTMGLVGGWSYSRTLCISFGTNCREATPGSPFDEQVIGDLSNCIPGDEAFYGFPPTTARLDFGGRCCLDGP